MTLLVSQSSYRYFHLAGLAIFYFLCLKPCLVDTIEKLILFNSFHYGYHSPCKMTVLVPQL
jgi:hypothetical protein